jgi:hypothetical protein
MIYSTDPKTRIAPHLVTIGVDTFTIKYGSDALGIDKYLTEQRRWFEENYNGKGIEALSRARDVARDTETRESRWKIDRTRINGIIRDLGLDSQLTGRLVEYGELYALLNSEELKERQIQDVNTKD